jgi:hypothetical protein
VDFELKIFEKHFLMLMESHPVVPKPNINPTLDYVCSCYQLE